MLLAKMISIHPNKALIIEDHSFTHLPLIETWLLILEKQGCRYVDICTKREYSDIVLEIIEKLKKAGCITLSVRIVHGRLVLREVLRYKTWIVCSLNIRSIWLWIGLILPRVNVFQTLHSILCLHPREILTSRIEFKRKVRLLIESLYCQVAYLRRALFVVSNSALIDSSPARIRCLMVCVPFRLIHQESQHSIGLAEPQCEFLNIIIPGIYDAKRRDYRSFLDSLKQELDKESTQKLRFVFLGSPRRFTKNILEYDPYTDLRELASLHSSNIIIFHDYVKQSEFDYWLQHCTFVLAITPKTFRESEIYGENKDSGVYYDALRSNGGLLAPCHLKIPQEFRELSTIYTSYKHLFQLLRNNNLSSRRPRDRFNEDFFYPEHVCERIAKVLSRRDT